MVLKLFSKQNFNFITHTAKKILKCNLCSAVPAQEVKHNYKYLLILDFEATCDTPQLSTQEIIEFPCLKINISTCKEEGRFHHYVKPTIQPVLSNFCVQLTGILQEMVDEAKTFPEVYKMFEDWRAEEGLTEENSLYVTSGDWDLGHMIRKQCALLKLEEPSHMKTWTDIKKLFALHTEQFYNSFLELLYYYDLEFQGRQHSGIDDCLNIFQVVKKMLNSGFEFKPTSRLSCDKVESIYSCLKEKGKKGPNAIKNSSYKRKRYRASLSQMLKEKN